MPVFSPGKLKFLAFRRRSVYRRVFESPDGQEVLVDLMQHCGWSKDLFNENPLVMSNLVGRRNVILHIKAILRSSDEQLEGLTQAHQERFEPFDE